MHVKLENGADGKLDKDVIKSITSWRKISRGQGDKSFVLRLFASARRSQFENDELDLFEWACSARIIFAKSRLVMNAKYSHYCDYDA